MWFFIWRYDVRHCTLGLSREGPELGKTQSDITGSSSPAILLSSLDYPSCLCYWFHRLESLRDSTAPALIWISFGKTALSAENDDRAIQGRPPDLQNLMHRLVPRRMVWMLCCGVDNYKDWDSNIYWNGTSPSREACDVLFLAASHLPTKSWKNDSAVMIKGSKETRAIQFIHLIASTNV